MDTIRVLLYPARRLRRLAARLRGFREARDGHHAGQAWARVI